MPNASVTLDVLSKYFSSVQPIDEYLETVLNGSKTQYAPNDADLDSYHCLLCNVIVAHKHQTVPRFDAYPPMMHMREIIDKAQEKLFKLNAPSNILTMGYRRSNSGNYGKRELARMGVTNFFLNTIITALQGPEWETLLQRVGIDAMLHLLTETSVFTKLPNDCLCQLTGEPLIFLPSKLGPLLSVAPLKRKKLFHRDDFARPHKRPRLLGSSIDSKKSSTIVFQEVTPANITIERIRLFYSRPDFIPRTNKVVVGLPSTHILNQLYPAYFKPTPRLKESLRSIDPRKQEEDVRLLSKYVFPSQYGLSNPFRKLGSGGGNVKADYSNREAEIKARGACKTPKRLKAVLPLLDKLLWRHRKCAYKPLRDKTCPSKLDAVTGGKDPDASVILEMMSESSIIITQANERSFEYPISSGNTSRRFSFSQAERSAKLKPRFIEFCCSYVEVWRYAVLVTKAVIPHGFWGGGSNFATIMENVKVFITCRRFESLSLHSILQGFSTAACDWLAPPGQQYRVSVSDALKRRELLEEFIFWYFDSFLVNLLRTTFYVTESSAFRNRVLYFRQDDWETLCSPLIERLTSTTFERLTQKEAEEVLRQRSLGFSFVRLLPKDTGVRPIVNLRKKKQVARGPYSANLSINQILQTAFQILTYEKENQPHRLGVGILSPDEAYSRLKQFKNRLIRDPSGNLPKLYFVKLDVQACFDTIEQNKLLHILQELITEDVYLVQRYGEVSSSVKGVRRRYVRKALPDGDHPHFLSYATDLANVLRGTIFIDQVVYPHSKKEQILQLLEEHITENIVKIGQHYFRQMVGIPQGSVLSALLCTFFYGDLEKRFGAFTDDDDSLLMRMIDDFLFITTSQAKAKAFLDMMSKGHPEYGCFIAKDKTLTNFDHDAEIMNVTAPQQTCFPWCGYMIDMRDLSVYTDYTRYHGTSLGDALTVDRGRNPGQSFLFKMLQLAKAKSHIIFTDRTLNSEQAVYMNVYQNFLLSAMKMHGYLRNLGNALHRKNDFVYGVIVKMIDFCNSSLRHKSTNKTALSHGGSCEIDKRAVVWLGTHAFHTVFNLKPQKHVTSTLKLLGFELRQPRYRGYKRRFRALVMEGFQVFSQIPF